MKLVTKLEIYSAIVFSFLIIPAVQSLCTDRVKVRQPEHIARTKPVKTHNAAPPAPGSSVRVTAPAKKENSSTKHLNGDLVTFRKNTQVYKRNFKGFVSKVKTAQTVTSFLPEWATDAINWGLRKCGSPYKLDIKEMDFLERFFYNKSKSHYCVHHADKIVDQQDLKDIFEAFSRTPGQFKDFKKVLKGFTIRSIPNVEDPLERKNITDECYYRVVTTNFMATHLYDQGFRVH